jgi:ABC-2 type transport system permease protein
MLSILMAGQIIFFSFFTGAYAMMSILREDEDGTLARLFTTPTHRTVILAGKFLAVVLTVTLQSLVLLLIGWILFHIAWGSPTDVALVVVGQVISASGLGVLLISLVKSTRQAGPVLGGVLTALGMAGGLFTSGVKMPAGFDAVSRFTPHGWVIQAWKLSMAGSPLTDLLLPVIILVLVGAVTFFAGSQIFARRFA